MNRLTSERMNGIKTGYWSAANKETLVQRLAAYENTGLEPEEILPAIQRAKEEASMDTAAKMAYCIAGALKDVSEQTEARIEADFEKKFRVVRPLGGFGPRFVGNITMPLRDNVPDPGPSHKDWRLRTCPICGTECWESDLARQALAQNPGLRAACTECALRGGLNAEPGGDAK